MDPVKFEISSLLDGYDIQPEKKDHYMALTTALTVITSAGLPFERDEVLNLSSRNLQRETTVYILSTHALSALKKFIAGTGRKKHFDWPIVGDKKSCTRVMSLLDILRDIAASLRTCPLFMIELMSQRMKMAYEDYIVFFLDELILHYEDTLKGRQNKGKNEKLIQFIESIRQNKRDFARLLLDSSDKGSTLAKGLRDFKVKTKADFRPDISPEKRYLDDLGVLDGKLKMKLRGESFASELVEDLRPVFNSISDLVEKNASSLQEDVFKFTDELCFQTCFQILEYVKLGESLIDLPWISRFIAEESVRTSISSGELKILGEEHRTKRIVAAYLGGLTYLILQAHRSPSR
jgi:hypothetical protein